MSHNTSKNSDENVKNTKVKISEVNAIDPVPIIPGEGNRNFDDPVIPNNEIMDKENILEQKE